MAHDSPRVLVVDDSVGVCTAVAMILQEDGYLIEMAHSYQQGRRLAFERNFKLAIVDVNLGRESGLKLSEEIVTSRVLCKVILTSGSVDLSQEFANHPALVNIPVLVKPFGRETLLQCVHRTLGEVAA